MAKSKILSPDEWFELAKEGQRYAMELCGGDRWKHYRDYYRAKYAEEVVYYYNLIYIHINTLRPNLYFKDPRVIVTPWKTFGPDSDPMRHIGAQILESIDNILITETKLKQTVKEAIFDAVISGVGPVKVGYSIENYAQDVGEEVKSSKDGKKRTEFNTSIRNGMPWAARVAPEQVLVPFGTRKANNMPWLIHVILRRMEDIQNSPYYEKGITDELKGSHLNLLADYVSDTYESKYVDDDWAEIHEVHDFRSGETSSYIAGEPDQKSGGRLWLSKPREDPYMKMFNGFNFDFLTFNEDSDYFWVTSDVKQLESQQIEMNVTRQQAVAHRAIAILKFLYPAGTFKQAPKGSSELDKLLRGQVGVGVEVQGDPKNIITFQPHIPQDIVLWPEYIRQDARELVGVGRVQAGTEAGGRKTATEINAQQTGFDSRIGERRDSVGELISSIITKYNALISKYWSAEDTVPILGTEGAIYWVKFKNSTFNGNYRVKVDTDSMNPTTIQMRRNEMLQILQSSAGMPGVPVDTIMRQLLSTYDWADVPTILPTGAGGNALTPQEFMQQQQGLSPEAVRGGRASAANAIRATPPPSFLGA